MNRSLTFRDSRGRFCSKPEPMQHTKEVNPLGARAVLSWDTPPSNVPCYHNYAGGFDNQCKWCMEYNRMRDRESECSAVRQLQEWAEKGELRGFSLETFSFEFGALKPAQHYLLGLAAGECNFGDGCKSCHSISSLYRDALSQGFSDL